MDDLLYNLFSFRGRISRLPYIIGLIVLIVFSFVLGLILAPATLQENWIVSLLLSGFFTYCNLALTLKRSRDFGLTTQLIIMLLATTLLLRYCGIDMLMLIGWGINGLWNLACLFIGSAYQSPLD